MAELAASLAESKKGGDINILEVGPVSSLAEYFVLCSADSSIQIKAITNEILNHFKAIGIEPLSHQKNKNPEWALIDFGDIVVHVFHKNAREHYQLERFWSHARSIQPKLDKDHHPTEHKQAS